MSSLRHGESKPFSPNWPWWWGAASLACLPCSEGDFRSHGTYVWCLLLETDSPFSSLCLLTTNCLMQENQCWFLPKAISTECQFPVSLREWKGMEHLQGEAVMQPCWLVPAELFRQLCMPCLLMLQCCPTATHCWSSAARVHPAGGAKLLVKPVHVYIWHVYAVKAVAVWVGILPLKQNQTYSFAAWGDGFKCLFKVGAHWTRVGLFLMVSLKYYSGYFSWENSCRQHEGKVHSACTEMVRSILAIGCLWRTWHSVWGKKKSGREETLSAVCLRSVRTWGTDVWLQAVWKGRYWESVSRK